MSIKPLLKGIRQHSDTFIRVKQVRQTKGAKECGGEDQCDRLRKAAQRWLDLQGTLRRKDVVRRGEEKREGASAEDMAVWPRMWGAVWNWLEKMVCLSDMGP